MAEKNFSAIFNRFGRDFDRFVRAQILTLISGTKDVLMRVSPNFAVSLDFAKLDKAVLDKLKDKQILVAPAHQFRDLLEVNEELDFNFNSWIFFFNLFEGEQ